MSIDLRKLNTKHQPQSRVARVVRDNVTIPHYWVVGGIVITNLSNAQEYKSSK